MVNTICDGIVEDKEVDKEVFQLEKELLGTMKPNIWNTHLPNNMERKIEVDSQMYMTSVIDHLGIDTETITGFDFYTSVKYLKEKFENEKQNNK